MTPKHVIRREALLELRDAAEWYEKQRPGLGGELVDEFERTIEEEVLATLELSAVYWVLYGGVAHVVAFEHGSREPGYWRGRVK